ncbi:MAG: hypothetical protein SGJ24_13965 [Chloroflexota bacterium]|nr:hypothetical protein [Chloroflexota bacterium]
MFRGGDNRNFVVGVMLVVALLFFMPRYLPNLVASILPQLYEGVPCSSLRTADDRANHQSLLGRSAGEPISLSVRTSGVPSDAAGSLWVTIAVTNNTVGSVAFVYDPQRVIVGDNNTSGLGIVFNPGNSLSAGLPRQDSGSVPESSLRILAPRQRCLHTVEFPGGNVLIDPNASSGSAQVFAYYRNNINGAINTSPIPNATPIFRDQGLWTGIVESAPQGIGRGDIPAP